MKNLHLGNTTWESLGVLSSAGRIPSAAPTRGERAQYIGPENMFEYSAAQADYLAEMVSTEAPDSATQFPSVEELDESLERVQEYLDEDAPLEEEIEEQARVNSLFFQRMVAAAPIVLHAVLDHIDASKRDRQVERDFKKYGKQVEENLNRFHAALERQQDRNRYAGPLQNPLHALSSNKSYVSAYDVKDFTKTYKAELDNLKTLLAQNRRAQQDNLGEMVHINQCDKKTQDTYRHLLKKQNELAQKLRLFGTTLKIAGAVVSVCSGGAGAGLVAAGTLASRVVEGKHQKDVKTLQKERADVAELHQAAAGTRHGIGTKLGNEEAQLKQQRRELDSYLLLGNTPLLSPQTKMNELNALADSTVETLGMLSCRLTEKQSALDHKKAAVAKKEQEIASIKNSKRKKNERKRLEAKKQAEINHLQAEISAEENSIIDLKKDSNQCEKDLKVIKERQTIDGYTFNVRELQEKLQKRFDPNAARVNETDQQRLERLKIDEFAEKSQELLDYYHRANARDNQLVDATVGSLHHLSNAMNQIEALKPVTPIFNMILDLGKDLWEGSQLYLYGSAVAFPLAKELYNKFPDLLQAYADGNLMSASKDTLKGVAGIGVIGKCMPIS